MSVWLLPAAAASAWLGVAAWPALGGWAPPWAWLALGISSLAGAAIAAPAPADRPAPLEQAGILGDTESTAATLVAPRRTGSSGSLVVALVLGLFGVGSVGAGWAGVRAHRLDASMLPAIAPDHATAVGSLRIDPAPSMFGWSAVVDLSRVEWGDGAADVDETVWAQGDGPVPALRRGDRLVIEGFVDVPSDPGFAESLRSRGIVATLQVDRLRRLGSSSSPIVAAAQAFRAMVARSIGRLLAPREAGLLRGLALGDDAGLDPGVQRDFQATGLGHLLVVSGENVAMVLAPMLALAALLRLHPWARFALGATTVAFFVVLTGAEPSVLRAGVMAGLTLLGVLGGRPRSTASALGAAVLVLVLSDPGLVSSIGFQLSVAATVGMIALSTPIADRMRFLPRPVALAAATTIAAQAGVTPLLLFQFHEVPGVTVVANLLAFPAVAPALLLGLSAAVVGGASPVLGRILAGAATLPLRWLEVLADRLAQAPVPALTWGGGAVVLVLGGAIVAGLVWRLRSGRRFPRPVVVVGAALVPLFVWSTALTAGPPSELRVEFFDVGQGDAALVTSPGGARILIDGGPDPDQVATELAARGVRRLDVVVASHPHADHIVGLPAVLTRFPVGLLLSPGCPDTSQIYVDLLRAIADEHVRVAHPRAGDSFAVGDLAVDVLSPQSCFEGTGSDANNDALVLRITYREDTVLFATEPEEPAQQAMLDASAQLHVELLKVPHHGAATSLPEFFEAADAELAIVSVGPNSYGHPVPATLAEIRDTGARVLRTDRLGDIAVTFASQGLLVESSGP